MWWNVCFTFSPPPSHTNKNPMHRHSIWEKTEFIWNGKNPSAKLKNMMTCAKHRIRPCTASTSIPLKGVCPALSFIWEPKLRSQQAGLQSTKAMMIIHNHHYHQINRQSNVSPRLRLQVFQRLAKQPCYHDKFSQQQASAHKRNIAASIQISTCAILHPY